MFGLGSAGVNSEKESQQDQADPDGSSGSSEKLHSISEDLLNVKGWSKFAFRRTMWVT